MRKYAPFAVPMALLIASIWACASNPLQHAQTVQQQAYAARANYDEAEKLAASAADTASNLYGAAKAEGKTSEANGWKAVVLDISAVQKRAYPIAEAVKQALLTYKPGDAAADAALKAQADDLASVTADLKTATAKKGTQP